ncbi:MAG: two-component system phosphate regulon sensor histidine kinase PhoR [Rhodothermales bacterium]
MPAAVAVPAVVTAGTYAAAVWMLARRLKLARTILRQIRNSQFENLEAAHLPKGDELNDLVWQVYRTGQVLEREITELRRMENYRREFIGNVSHELKTPIFAIRGFAETLEGGALDDARVNRTFLGKILRNADRLDSLVRDLGEIARMEHGELKMQLAPFDLKGLAVETLESLETVASGRKVRLQLSLPSGLPKVVGDAHHIRQVLVNLMENAIKYNDENGTIELVARPIPGGNVKISVVDDGIGIPAELIPRITERFFRVDKSRSRSQGGTGLGLAIVKHILAAHDRTLLVESRVGYGSTFGFSLPVFDPTSHRLLETATEKATPTEIG